MKLYTTAGSPEAQKVLVVSQLAGKDVAAVTDASEKDLKGKTPTETLPILETSSGCLSGSDAIAAYLAAGKAELVGKDAFEQAQINSWVDFTKNQVAVPAQLVTYPIIGWQPNEPEVIKLAMADLVSALKTVEAHLKLETYLVGRNITLADVALASALVLPMKMALGDKERKPFTCVTRWFTTCVNHPAFAKVIGPVSFVKKAVQPSAPAKAAAAAPAAPAAAAKPAEEKKAETPLQKLAKLPKSAFNLDEWKKTYSNAPGHDYYKSMDWFWANLDSAGWSIWKSEYNYNDELPAQAAFLASNLAGGFIQRCDCVRKFAFGALNILGGTGDKAGDGKAYELTGVWLFRGSAREGIDALLDENPDAEYHTWTQIKDPSDADKKMIAEWWCDEEKNDGKEIIDGKVFK